VALVIAGLATVTVSTKVAVPDPAALVAPIVTLVVPVAVGVPVTRPVVALTDNPAGSPVALKLAGAFVAAI
jgi:hypothetical protein